jgi:DNA-binding transcriptional MerR regulator
MSESIVSGGAYTVERAAALSGVPRSTVHYWARNGHLLPSVSEAPRLYSFTDLLALRVLYWLPAAEART